MNATDKAQSPELIAAIANRDRLAADVKRREQTPDIGPETLIWVRSMLDRAEKLVAELSAPPAKQPAK